MSSKKRKSSSTSSSSSSSQQQRLFSTLASIEQTDARATQKRKQSHISSLSQSRAANDQVKLNAILLELRILMQRCLDVGDDVLSNSQSSDTTTNDDVQVEIDSLLENLLIARRELLGHDMMKNQSDNDDNDHDDGSDEDGDDVDYAALIRQDKGKSKDDDNDDDSSSTDNSSGTDNNTNLLSKQLQNEYESLRTSWKSILNKHHSNLALHSGMSVNSSKFQSKAVDLSFWEQVNFVTSQTTATAHQSGGGGQDKGIKGCFDDSKLYQQMLKDFISQSSSGSGGGGGGSSGGKRLGSSIDPAQEAAERLKRAMRKKNGVEGDVDLSTLLLPTQDGGSTKDSTNAAAAAASAKKANLDRRASKGRKIRYTVHPKLVNFTFPVARPEPMIKEDIWFKSLFGGVGRF
jgi:hypothetical protein